MAQLQSWRRLRTRLSRPGKTTSCSTVVPCPKISKRAKMTELPAFTLPGVGVPKFTEVALVAQSKTMSILARCSFLPWVSWRQRTSDFSAIRWRCLNFYPRSLARLGRTNKPRVFQVQTRSPFAGKWRHVEETASCT